MRYMVLLSYLLFITALCACAGLVGSEGGSSASHGPSSVAAALTCTAEKHSPGPAPIRRLTKREYVNSIQDIFGVDVSAQAEKLPLDPIMNGFRNNAVVLTVTVGHAEVLQTVAEHVAEQVLASPDKLAQFTGDCNTSDQSCVEQAARTLGRLVYRHPLLEDGEDNELARLMSLAGNASGNEAIGLMIEGVLQSPRFFFRGEFGEINDERPDLLKLSGYEMAARLSFMLWQSTPDESLLAAAETGKLATKDQIVAMTNQMLEDPRAKASMHVFADQWLKLPHADNTTVELIQAEQALQDSAHEEAARLIDDFLWTDADITGIFDATYGYVDSMLASHYGLSGTGASGFEKTELVAQGRGGFFGTASFLMMAAPIGKPPVIHRGKFIRDVLLCDPPPPVPPDLNPSPDAERMSDPVCSGCHQLMDPIGNGLEMFDQLGNQRDAYEDSSPLPTTGAITGFSEPDFYGPLELGKKIAAEPQTQACIVENFFHWALGRLQDTVADSCTLDALNDEFGAKGRNFKELIVDFVQSEAFRFRIPIE